MAENVGTDARPLRELVAKEIKVLLIRRDMNGGKLAAAMGKSEMYVSRRLRGETPFDLDDLALVAAALGVSPATLLRAALDPQDTLRNPLRRQTPRSDPRRPPAARPSNVDAGSRRPRVLAFPR